jgi:hypothetical protein
VRKVFQELCFQQLVMKIYTAKRHPITCPEGTEEEQRYSYTPS